MADIRFAVPTLFLPKIVDGIGLSAINIEFDILETERHDFQTLVTKHVLESGSDVTDHVENLQPVITIKGILSDTPTNPLLPLSDSFKSSIGRGRREAFKLLALKDEGVPFIFVTRFAKYSNVVFENLTIEKNQDTGNTVIVLATLRKIFTAVDPTSVNTISSNLDSSVEHSGAESVDTGFFALLGI